MFFITTDNYTYFCDIAMVTMRCLWQLVDSHIQTVTELFLNTLIM